MTEKLLHCPFCGGEALEISFTDTIANGWIGCQSCRCFIDWVKNGKPQAIAAWNRRTKPENEPLVRCGECAKHQSPNCAVKHEQALMDFCSHGVRKPERSKGE